MIQFVAPAREHTVRCDRQSFFLQRSSFYTGGGETIQRRQRWRTIHDEACRTFQFRALRTSLFPFLPHPSLHLFSGEPRIRGCSHYRASNAPDRFIVRAFNKLDDRPGRKHVIVEGTEGAYQNHKRRGISR